MNEDILIDDEDKSLMEFDSPKFEKTTPPQTQQDAVSGTYEETTGTQEQGVLKWVYNPNDIFQQFELYLRGIRLNHATGQYEQLYKGYYYNENGEKILVPYRLMNDKGINDAMSVFTIYVNKVNSFTRYNVREIDDTMKFFIFNYHERYIIHKSQEFEVHPQDGFAIVNMMYDLIRSGWRQSLGGSSLNMLGRTTKVTEVVGQGSSKGNKPAWKFW